MWWNINKRRLWLVVAIVTCCCVHTVAQDFKTVIRQVHQRYTTLDTLFARMRLVTYDSAATTPRTSEKIEIRKVGRNFLYHYGDLLLMLNGQCLIVINAENKLIQYAPQNKDALMPDIARQNLDSLLNMYDEPLFVDREDAVVQYRIERNASITIDLWIDLETMFIRRTEYRYPTGERVTLAIEHFDPHALLDAGLFRESHYVVRNGNGWKPAPGYEGYEVQ
ncbi:LolA family protein [Chryseolinea lacunae]|uniref:Outer membrane lipoprotein carrier protein LolA n=1 Tax=Chryseolinea lacunae TaxID=2801331 RepID=A0ABS1KZM6_9BACT|nr:hypothetical protein [Chryseolinea lacunae]MBL0744800.1 hypothetical protein [Chryseolinea lacunae]